MFGDLIGFSSRSDPHTAARERHHLQLVLFEQIAQRLRAVTKVFENVAAQLDPGESECGDVFDRLRIIPVPGDCCVPEADHSGGWRERLIWRARVQRGTNSVEANGRSK